MINKERLETLIKEGATIYEVKYNNINPVSLTNKIRDVYYKNGVIMFEPRPNEKYLHHKYLKNLFETIEEAEWHKEFGCLKRIERLVLPTWEEFRVIGSFAFYDYKHNLINMMICLDPDNIAPCNDCIYIADNKKEYFCKPKTKENYTLACRKCKELFLGEEDE